MFKVALINYINDNDKNERLLKVTNVIDIENLDSLNDVRKYSNAIYANVVNNDVKTGMLFNSDTSTITDENGKQIYPPITSEMKLDIIDKQIKSLTFNKDIDNLTLEELQDYLIKKNKHNLELFLENNPMKYNNKYYTVTSDKQNQLTGLLNAYKFAKDINIDIDLTWNETGKECEPYTYEQLIQIYLAMLNYIKPLVTHQQETELRIKQSSDSIQANKIDITFNQFLTDKGE